MGGKTTDYDILLLRICAYFKYVNAIMIFVEIYAE